MGGKLARVTQQLQQNGTYPLLSWAVPLLWLLVIGGITLVWHVGSIGLIDETEPLFVEASRQMNLTGNWITPYFDTETRFDKPPLIYWLMVLAFKVFGVNEFAARLPSVLSAFVLVLFCYYMLRQVGPSSQSTAVDRSSHAAVIESSDAPIASPATLPIRPLTAWLGATMLLLNPNTFFWGRTGYSDMLLTVCIGSCLLAFFLGYAQPQHPKRQWCWYVVFYVCMALAVLTKGPIGVILPALVIGPFLFYVGNVKPVLQGMRLGWGALLVALLAVPWYILVTLANGEAFIDSFFGYHNIERFTHVVNHHAGPWYFHFAVILVGFLPWSAYLPAAIVRVKPLRRRYWQAQPPAQQLGIFALFWFGAILGFFTIATTKYFSYTLPLMPAAAILVALLWTDILTQPQTQRGFLLSAGFNLVLLLAMAGATLYSPHWLGSDPWMPNLGTRLQQAGLPVAGGIIWGITAIAVVVLLVGRRRWIWLANLVGFLAFLILVVQPMVLVTDAERQLPLRQIAQTIVQTRQPGDEVIMLGFKKPSLVFYTQRPVTFLTQPAKVVPYLQEANADRKGALIVAADTPLKQSGLQPNQYQEIRHAGVYRLVRLTPGGSQSPSP